MKSVMELFKGDAVKFFGINSKIIASARTELTHIPVQRNTDDWVWETDEDYFLHFEFQSALLTNKIANKDEQLRVQAMIGLLAVKFLDATTLQEIKELMKMNILFDMMREEGIKEGIKEGSREKSREIARGMLKDDMDINIILKYTKLSESSLREIQMELENA